MLHLPLSGLVSADLCPIVRLTYSETQVGSSREEEFIVDTGFNGHIVLKEGRFSEWNELWLTPVLTSTSQDVNNPEFVNEGLIFVNLCGRVTPGTVKFMGCHNLLGMGLMDGHRLEVACEAEGSVDISPI